MEKIFKKGCEVYVKDLEIQLPTSAIFIKYNKNKKSIFKYVVIKRGCNYETNVMFCKLKGINQTWY